MDLDFDRPILVIGASGFVGSHVTRRLVLTGRKVRVLLRRTRSQQALRGLPLDVVYGDILDPSSLRSAMQGCGTVFYSVVEPRFWLTDQVPIYRNNAEGLLNGRNPLRRGDHARIKNQLMEYSVDKQPEKLWVITGAAGGMGSAIAAAFARGGSLSEILCVEPF
jgi:NAD(P)-dependent dehydrogenase (short-subunit alcohol dehydrogenase family)